MARVESRKRRTEEETAKGKQALKEAIEKKNSKELHLSKEERLEFQNIHLRRQMLDAQVRQQVLLLEQEQEALIQLVNKRVGEDIANYKVDLQTGKCVWDENAARMNASRKARFEEQAIKANAEEKAL